VALPDAGNVEDYTEEEFNQLLAMFATDKGKLSKKQQAAVARYNFKKGKNEPIVFKGQGAPPGPAPPPGPGPAPNAPAAAAPAGATVAVDPALIPLLPPEAQALARKDPATLTKEEKIALAKAKSQAVKAQMQAPPAAPKEEGPKGPSPEEVAREKALAFAHASALDAKFADAIEGWSMQVASPYATVKADRILDVVRWLRAELGFDFLRNLTAADYAPERFEVVYNLLNQRDRSTLALRVKLPRAAPAGMDMPTLASVTSVHPGADWLEREVFDLFGIRFAGHPYMRRLMMPDDWVGHPLRKDYDNKTEQFVGLGADGRDIVSTDPTKGW
jgi:NADH-quinone oxidoreductase subunit C